MTRVVDGGQSRPWVDNAVRLIEADARRSAEFGVPRVLRRRAQRDHRGVVTHEGIGRPRVEPSFLAEIVDRMISVPDAASIAAARDVSGVLGRRVGPSTGTNVWGAFGLLAEIVSAGRSGSVVTLLADGGDRYADTYFCDEWVASMGLDPTESAVALVEFEKSCRWPAPSD